MQHILLKHSTTDVHVWNDMLLQDLISISDVRQCICHMHKSCPTTVGFLFLTHPCRRQPLKIFFISNDRGRSLFEAFDWLFICLDPSDVSDLRVKVVVENETL